MFRNAQLDRIEKKLDTILNRLPAELLWDGFDWNRIEIPLPSVSPAKPRPKAFKKKATSKLQEEVRKILTEDKPKRKYVRSGKYAKKVTTKKK